jgi:hypothetical protein
MCQKIGSINHRLKSNNKSGFNVVPKSCEIVFLDPCTQQTNANIELIEKWLLCKNKPLKWNDLFALANATEYHEILSVEAAGVAQSFLKHARSYQSSYTLDIS